MSKRMHQLIEHECEQARAAPMPKWEQPMLATRTDERFSRPEWVFERKLDGERAMAYVSESGAVRLMSRNKQSINDSYPEIEEVLAHGVSKGCILDGEIVAFKSRGVSDFQRLQERMHSSSRAEARQSTVRVFYYLFDCLYLAGHDLTKCKLRNRKKLLRAAVTWRKPLRWTPHRNEDGLGYFEQACRKGWEGLIAKRADSAYVHSRSRNWLKFKCTKQQEFVICGFTDPEGERVGLGALLLGFYHGDKLVHAGRVGTGFDRETLRVLRERLEGLEQHDSPYDAGEPRGKGVHFVAPELVCEVAFTEWTQDHKLRHSRYQGLRRDKQANKVRRES